MNERYVVFYLDKGSLRVVFFLALTILIKHFVHDTDVYFLLILSSP